MSKEKLNNETMTEPRFSFLIQKRIFGAAEFCKIFHATKA